MKDVVFVDDTHTHVRVLVHTLVFLLRARRGGWVGAEVWPLAGDTNPNRLNQTSRKRQALSESVSLLDLKEVFNPVTLCELPFMQAAVSPTLCLCRCLTAGCVKVNVLAGVLQQVTQLFVSSGADEQLPEECGGTGYCM